VSSVENTSLALVALGEPESDPAAPLSEEEGDEVDEVDEVEEVDDEVDEADGEDDDLSRPSRTSLKWYICSMRGLLSLMDARKSGGGGAAPDEKAFGGGWWQSLTVVSPRRIFSLVMSVGRMEKSRLLGLP
jgi:hypothetical protein